jgi:hypothetical protein
MYNRRTTTTEKVQMMNVYCKLESHQTSVQSNTYLTISNYSPIYSVDGICFQKI